MIPIAPITILLNRNKSDNEPLIPRKYKKTRWFIFFVLIAVFFVIFYETYL